MGPNDKRLKKEKENEHISNLVFQPSYPSGQGVYNAKGHKNTAGELSVGTAPPPGWASRSLPQNQRSARVIRARGLIKKQKSTREVLSLIRLKVTAPISSVSQHPLAALRYLSLAGDINCRVQQVGKPTPMSKPHPQVKQ